MSIELTELSKPVRASDLAGGIRDEIEKGNLQPGDRLPTFAAIRERYGAATNTVDRAYSQLEDDGVIERKAGSGVYVAEPHVTGVTGTIGCLGAGFKGFDPYWNHCIEGINSACEEHGVHAMLLPRSPANNAWDKVDGLLCHNVDSLPDGCPATMPYVSFLHRMPDTVSVIAGDFEGMMTATQYLIDLGHRRIGSLIIHDDPLGIVRIGGYEGALRRAGIKVKLEWSRDCSGDFDNYSFTEVARRITDEWLKGDWEKNDLTALVTQNDHVAIGAVHALEDAGLNVPADVSVVGFDGTELSQHSRPRLTTVKVPLENIGRRAANELIDHIQNGQKKDEQIIQLPVELIVGESTANSWLD